MASETCKILKGDILLHVRVTHEDVWKKIQKNVKSCEKDKSYGLKNISRKACFMEKML